MFDASRRKHLFSGRRLNLGAALLASLLVTILPRRAVEPLRALYGRLLEPGQLVAGRLVDSGRTLARQVHQRAATADEIVALTDNNRKLLARTRELETALALAGKRAPQNDPSAGAAMPPPLIANEAMRARIIGRRACAALPATEIVALGSASGVRRDALALADSTVVLDAGRDVLLAGGELALAGRHVFGKVLEVGPHTCIVRRADQPSYRDVVQLAKLVDGQPRPGPQGMLEGAGDGCGRVRLITASETVSPGDLVLTADDQGLAPQPFLYGTVTRCERPPGATHWNIWVDLSAGLAEVNDLLVLRTSINPARMAALPGRDADRE